MRNNAFPTLGFCILAALVAPAAPSHAAAPIPARPALELRKMVSFPLESDTLPTSSEDLMRAVTAGLNKRVILPQGAKAVQAQGGDYPMLEGLTVDLTNGSISSDRTLPKLQPRGPVQKGVQAQEFRFIANPMKIDGANVRLNISARDVDLGLQRDERNKPILILAAAQDGRVQFDTTMTDLCRIFRASANARGKKYGLSVQSAVLKLTSENEHQLKADLTLESELTLLPISLHFTGKVDVDDAGNAKVSDLSCKGTNIAGWLIGGFIQPALDKQNNKTLPLIAFPTEQIKLQRLRVKIDGDAIQVSAGFGNAPTTMPAAGVSSQKMLFTESDSGR